jgi:hypothetical protein
MAATPMQQKGLNSLICCWYPLFVLLLMPVLIPQIALLLLPLLAGWGLLLAGLTMQQTQAGTDRCLQLSLPADSV